MKKALFYLAIIIVAASCSADRQEETTENLTFELSTQNEYRGVFTTLDGSKRAKVFIKVPTNNVLAKSRIATARFEMPNGKVQELKGSIASNSNAIYFQNEHSSFRFQLSEGENEPTFTEVLFFGLEGDILAKKHTARGPVTPVTGTYECGTCNGHPILGSGATQTFNFIFSVADGNGSITTQTTLGGTVYNGIGIQENCTVTGTLTNCELSSGDGSSTTTGFLANGNPVTWTGTHLFNNEPSGPNDCSGVSGNWQWPSVSYGLISGTFLSDDDCSTELVFEDFEDATITYTTSVPEFTDNNSDYFLRTDGSNISSGVNFSGVLGTSFFAAQDIDGEVASPEQSILFNNLDVTTISTIHFSAFFAEDDDGSNEDWDDDDFLIVEYSFDGSTFTPFFAIENDGSAFNEAPLIDTNLDGDGDGAEITETFTEYSASFVNDPVTNPGASTTVTIRIRMRVDAGDEDIAIDNITISGI